MGEFLASSGGMRWTPGGRSPNLEDRRGRGFGGPVGIGGGLITLILALISARLDDRIYARRDLEALSSLPVMGVIPVKTRG